MDKLAIVVPNKNPVRIPVRRYQNPILTKDFQTKFILRHKVLLNKNESVIKIKVQSNGKPIK